VANGKWEIASGKYQVASSKLQVGNSKLEERLNLALYDAHLSRRRSISNGTEVPISTDEKSG
jgi:hypothetical protein